MDNHRPDNENTQLTYQEVKSLIKSNLTNSRYLHNNVSLATGALFEIAKDLTFSEFEEIFNNSLLANETDNKNIANTELVSPDLVNLNPRFNVIKRMEDFHVMCSVANYITFALQKYDNLQWLNGERPAKCAFELLDNYYNVIYLGQIPENKWNIWMYSLVKSGLNYDYTLTNISEYKQRFEQAYEQFISTLDNEYANLGEYLNEINMAKMDERQREIYLHLLNKRSLLYSTLSNFKKKFIFNREEDL
jgi:hypothetical protein